MTWEIDVLDEFEKGTLADVVDSAVGYVPEGFTEGDIDNAVRKAIDERCFSNITLLEIIQYCGHTSEAFDTLAYETFYGIVRDMVSDEVEEEEE